MTSMPIDQASAQSNTQPHTELLALAARTRAQLTASGGPFEVVTIEQDGVQLPAFRNAFNTLPEFLAAGRVHGEKEFMVYGSDRWSFARFYAAVDALAGNLQMQCSLSAGDPVAIAMRNRPEWAVAFVAIALVGAVPVPLNSFGLRDELLANLRDVKPRWLICDQDRHARVGADLQALDCRAIVVDANLGAYSWTGLIATGAPAFQSVALAPQDPALILFTSGASSQAKGVLSTQRAVCQALCNIDFIGAISALTSPAAVAAIMARGLQPTTLSAVPLFHVSGLHAQLLSSLRNGRRLVFMQRWDPATALEHIRTERITQFNGAPAMVQQLLNAPGFDDPEVTGTLGGLGFGGAGLPQGLIDEVLMRRADSLSGIGFGMTESNGAGAAASGALFRMRPQSSGQLSPIVELQVVDDQGNPLPTDQRGEICLRGVTLMQGYWGPNGVNRAFSADGWFRSGDIGFVDADGFLHVVDRIKDVINRSGEKISAAEVESCLLLHSQIVEAAVVGVPDLTTGEAVVAMVVLAEGAHIGGSEVRQHVANHLAAYKVPVRVYLQHSVLPRNPAGKLLKSAIRKLIDAVN